jgi:hypothetical protein
MNGRGGHAPGERGGDHATLPTVRIGSHHDPDQPAPTRLLLQLRHALDPGRSRAAGGQEGSQEPARTASAGRPRTSPQASASRNIATCRLLSDPAPPLPRERAMVTHYEPARLRRAGDQPTAITDVLVATSASTYRTGDIPLGTPTSSARSRQGLWALYPSGAEVVVVHPGGAMVGAPADVAGELRRLGGNGQDELAVPRRVSSRDSSPAPMPTTIPGGRRGGRGPGRARPWATGSAAPPTTRATPPTSRPAGPVHWRVCHSHWLQRPVAPHSAPPSVGTTTSRLTADRPEERPHTSHPDGSPAPVK